jgi:hypothetical protein
LPVNGAQKHLTHLSVLWMAATQDGAEQISRSLQINAGLHEAMQSREGNGRSAQAIGRFLERDRRIFSVSLDHMSENSDF